MNPWEEYATEEPPAASEPAVAAKPWEDYAPSVPVEPVAEPAPAPEPWKDYQAPPAPARGVPTDAPTIGGVPLPDSMLPMTPAAAAEASRAAPVQATPEQRQASFQETAAKTADLRRRIEIAERAGNKEGAQQLIQDLEAIAPGTVARQEKQNAQLRTLTKMGIGGAVAGPAALLTSTIAAPANEAIMSREIDTDLPPSDSLAQYWKYGAQSFRSQVKMVAKKPETVDDWLKFQESAAKLKVAEEKLVPGEGFVRKGLQGLANSAPAMIDTLVQSGGFAPASFKQWADQGTAMILSDALRGKDVRSMSKEQLDEFYYMARGAGALYAGVEFGQSPLALTKALGFDVGGNIAGKVIKMAAENPVFKRKLVQIGMRFAGRTAAEIGEEGLQQPITDLTTDAIKTMAENPDKGKVAATWDNLAAKWWDYTKGSAEAMKQAIIPAAGMILGGKVVETPFRLAAAQEAKKKAAAPGPQPGPEDAEPVRDIEKFKQEWREAELPEDVITKLADNYAKGDKAGEDAIIAEYEASQAAAAREAAKTPATATGVPTTPAQGPAGEGGKAADVATPETTQKDEPIYSQNSTQANVRGPVADAVKAVAAKIPDADVMPTKQGVGREDDPHITLKYGVEDNASESIKGIARAHPPITATLGKMSVFPPSPNSDGAAVVHVEIDSPELHALRKQIDEAAGSRADDFDYKPHITVAYVKPEASAKYEGGTDLEGQKVTLDSIAVSDRNGKQIELKLEGKPDAAAPKIRVDRADGKTQANPPGQSISRDGIRDTAGTEATRPPAPAKGTGVRASPDVQPQEKVKEKASEVVPEKPEVPQREREPARQLQEGRQAADEAPEPRQPDVLSRQAQPAATPTSTAGGVAGPTPLSPESAAKPQDTGREPTITAPGDATREIYPQEFEDRIKAGLNPAQEAERIPGSPSVAEKSLHEAQAAKITGNKVKAIAQDGSVYRGLLYSLAQHSPATADMFYGAGTVTYYLHRAGILKPGHTISEFEPLRAVMARQLAGPNFQRVADETKRLVKQINGMLVAAEKIATNATTGDEIVAAFAKHLAAMPDPSEQTYAIRKQHEQDIVASFIDAINSFPDRYQEKNAKPPGAKEIEQAWRLSTRLYMLRFWSDLKFPEYLAEGQDLREMRKKLRKREELLAKYPELEGMDENTPKDATQEWLFGQLQKTEMTEPPRLKDTPETAAFNMAVQWIVGGNDAIATQPGEVGGLKTLFTMLKGGADWTDSEIDTVVRKNHEALKDSTVLQADSWPEIVRLAGEKPGVLIIADPSYFAEDETKGTKNYGVFTEIKKGDQLLAKVDQYLIPAWKKGARIILTNTYEPNIVKRLQDRGFNVVTFERDGGTREFAAYNANPETGEILPPRPASRWAETERKARGRQFEFKPRSEPDATGGAAGVQTSPKRVAGEPEGETGGRGGVRGGKPKSYDWEEMKKLYGVAEDPLDAGFILPDGTLLDLGRWTSGGKKRMVDHFEVPMETAGDRSNYAVQRMLDAGAIRLNFGGVDGEFGMGIELSRVPSDSQLRAIERYVDAYDREVEMGHITGPHAWIDWVINSQRFKSYHVQPTYLSIVRGITRAAATDIQASKRRKTARTTEKVKARAALIEGPVDFALSDYPIPYLPRRAKDRTGGTRDPINSVMSTLRYYAREGTMEQKRIARELLDRWTDESSRSPDEWYQEMADSNPAVAGTDLGDFMANIVAPEIDRIMEGRELTPSDQFMDKEAEGEAEDAYRGAVEGMEAGSAAPDVFKQAPALAQIGTTAEKPYRIVYPEGTVEAYRDAEGWHVRTNRLLPFRRVDGTKAGRAMAASLNARLAAANGAQDEQAASGMAEGPGDSQRVERGQQPGPARQPEARPADAEATPVGGIPQQPAVSVDDIPVAGTSEVSRSQDAAAMAPLMAATQYAEENLDAARPYIIQDLVLRGQSEQMAKAKADKISIYRPDPGDAQWEASAAIADVFQDQLVPTEFMPYNGLRPPRLGNVILVDKKNDFPVIVTTGHELWHGFKQYDTGTKDPKTNPYLALKMVLDEQVTLAGVKAYLSGTVGKGNVGKTDSDVREELYGDFMGEMLTEERFWKRLYAISQKAFDLLARFVNRIIGRVNVPRHLSVMDYFTDAGKAMDAAAAFYKHVIESKTERTAAPSDELPFSAKREPNLFQMAKALEAQPPEGMDEHRFTKHVRIQEDVPEAVRKTILQNYYEVKPKKVTSDNAARRLKQFGDVNAAEASIFGDPDWLADERIAAAIMLHAKYVDVAANESLSKEIRDVALRRLHNMGHWIDDHFKQYGQAINQAKLFYHDMSSLQGQVSTLNWMREAITKDQTVDAPAYVEAIAEVAQIERVQVEKQAEAIPEDMVAKAIYDEVVKRYRALDEVNQRLRMRSAAKILKAIGDVIADPVRRNAPSLAEANKKIEEREAKAMERLKAKLAGIQASEKRDLPGDDIIPEPDRSDLIDLTVGQIRKNGMADVVAFTKWIKDTFGTAYEGKEISSVWYDAVQQYGETIAPYLTGPAKAKHAKAKESIKKDRELQMDLPAQPSPFLGFSSEELAKYRKTELQGIIDQTRLRATGTTQPTPEEAAQMELQARQDAPQGDIFPKELFLKAKAQDVIDLTKLSANAKAVFLAATTPDTTTAELYAQAGVPTEGVPYTNIIDAKLADLLTKPVLEKAIREHLRTWNESLARLAMQDASAGETLAGSLAKQLTATFGLTPYKASILEQAIRKKVVRMTEAARQKELKRILSKKPDVKPRTRKQKQALDRVVSLNNLGAFDQQQIHDAILRELGILKPITTDEMEQLKKNADAVKNAPEGFQQRDAVIDARHYISKLAGPNWYRLGMGVIYNNLLFNYRTDQRNFISNLSMATSSLISNIAADPKTAPARIAGYIQGTVPGLLEASAAMRGMSVVRMEGKLELPGGTRFRDLPGKAGKLLAPLDIGNISAMKLVAGDMLLFKPAEYAHMEAMVLNELLQEGISYGQAVKQAREKLYGTKAERMARRQQAEREIAARPGKFTRLGRRIDVSRRAEELRLQSLPQDQLAQARMLAAIDTFNFKSEGILGHISQWLSAFGENKDIALPARFAVRNLVLFTNIIANVSNFAWAGLPVLGKVQLTGRFGLRTYKSDYDRVVHHRLMQMNALAIVGILLADLVASGFFDDDEDEQKKKQKDPWFAIYGLGPDDKATRELMRAQGWKPFTIKVGDRYIQYQLITPLAGALTVLGSIRDAQRFDLIKDEKTWQAYASYGAVSLAQSMLNMSFLSTTADLLSAISEPSKDLAIKSINKFLSSIPGRLVPAASLQREVAYQIDPRQFEAKGVLENLMRDIPFASKHLEPSVNILGDEVIRDRSVLITKAKPDPVYRLLADNDAVPSYPGKATRIEVPAERADPDGTAKLTPDEYHAYVKISGQLIKRQVTEELSDLRTMSTKEVQDRVEKITKDARDQAKAAIEQAAQDPSYDPETLLK